MTQAPAEEQPELLETLSPSAWMRDSVKNPDNSIAILGKKGGVGKSSLAAMILDAGVRFGLNVLGLDGDPQGNLSLALDCKVKQVPVPGQRLGGKTALVPDRDTMVEVFDANEDGVIDDAVQLSGWMTSGVYNSDADFTRGGPLIPGKLGTLGIVPAYKAMEDISKGWTLADVARLDRALNKPTTPGGVVPRVRWDLSITDMLPGGADLARAILKAQRRFLLLTTAEPFGMNAIADTLEFAHDVRDNWDSPNLAAVGMVFTSYTPTGVVTRNEMNDLRALQATGDPSVAVEALLPRVSTRSLVPNSQGFRAPVSAFLADSKQREAAKEMCQIAEAIVLEILRRIGHPDVEDLDKRWRAAWGEDQLSPWATGKIIDKEIRTKETH